MSEFIKQKQVEGLVSALAAKALDSAVVKKANNLSDVNAASARNNLEVYSKTEVQNLVAGAEDAYSVATLTARSALTGLKVSDRIFVSNDGDDRWALYIVTAITDGKGSTTTFTKIADEDLFTNALSKEAVKSAYESNVNTNAFTDAEKTKVGHLSVSQATNLDTMESDLASTKTTATNALNTANSATTKANAAQTTANGAVSDAAAAQSTADAAQSDAGAAEAAQSSANTARSEATAAQNTANSALTAANARELAFTEFVEDFTGLDGAAAQPIIIDLSKPIASGFIPTVFFNGIRVKNITYTSGARSIAYTVPYQTEASDTISVHYVNR